MGNFYIPDDPQYDDQVRQFETTDEGHADIFNAVIEKLVHNDAFLKNVTDQLVQEAEQHAAAIADGREYTDTIYQQATEYADEQISQVMGTSDIVGIGDGTIKGALRELNTGLTNATVHKIWNAVTKANTWSRICYVRSSNITGSSAILHIKATRNSVVCNATFLINASHPSCCNIVQLGANSYSRLTIRSVADSSGNYYLELYDAGEDQVWNCAMVDIQSSNITVYTAFTDGSTIPSGFSVSTHFTVTTGRTMVADNFIGTASEAEGARYLRPYNNNGTDLYPLGQHNIRARYANGAFLLEVINNNTDPNKYKVCCGALGRSGDPGLPMTFWWSDQAGQPAWLWGGGDGSNMYLYNPSNFSVDSAKKDGNGAVIADTYLKNTGGTMKGSILMERNQYIQWFSAAGPLIGAFKMVGDGGQFALCPDGWASTDNLASAIYIGRSNNAGGYAIVPKTDNLYNCGTSSGRLKQVYAANSAISTSDECLKKGIKELDDSLIQKFIMGLTPISYIMVDGDSGRTHYGFGARSIEKLMKELGMTSMDFAGLIKSPKTEIVEIEEDVWVEKEDEDENGKKVIKKVLEKQKRIEQRVIKGEYIYGLRYEEFISPTIKMVQMQQRQLEEQAAEIRNLRKEQEKQAAEIQELREEKDKLEERLRRIEKALGL